MDSINWTLAAVGHERFEGYSKFYRGRFRVGGEARFTLQKFGTATEAELYALAVMTRYRLMVRSRTPPPTPPHLEERQMERGVVERSASQ